MINQLLQLWKIKENPQSAIPLQKLPYNSIHPKQTIPIRFPIPELKKTVYFRFLMSSILT